jgi:hypothetical protein
MRTSFILLIATALVTGGCTEIDPDERSGRDQNRAGAQEIALDVVVTDALNPVGGDSTDWKVFEISETGTYTIELFWDARNIESRVNLHDQFGSRMESITHNVNRQRDEMVVQLPDVGIYYLSFQASQHYSTYSVYVYAGQPREAQTLESDPRPEYDGPI